MSEEIKKTGAEINEAALSGVSGGHDQSLDEAKRVCKQCKQHNPKACQGGSPELLVDLPSKVTFFTRCPYYGEPVG